jgi:hypothetical protein
MDSVDWIRSPQSKALLWATLGMSLVLGASLIVVDRHRAEAPGVPLSDDQAAGQVVNAARQVVAAARLQQATGGYSFVSCVNENEPPYQAALYMSFRLPHDDWMRYQRDIVSAMIAQDWVESPVTGEQFGRKLTKDGVSAVLERSNGDRAFATMRLYGECRNTADHRNDDPAWTEVSL